MKYVSTCEYLYYQQKCLRERDGVDQWTSALYSTHKMISIREHKKKLPLSTSDWKSIIICDQYWNTGEYRQTEATFCSDILDKFLFSLSSKDKPWHSHSSLHEEGRSCTTLLFAKATVAVYVKHNYLVIISKDNFLQIIRKSNSSCFSVSLYLLLLYYMSVSVIPFCFSYVNIAIQGSELCQRWKKKVWLMPTSVWSLFEMLWTIQ